MDSLDNDRPYYPSVLASVCHHAIAWTTLAIGPSPLSDPATALCHSCEEFNKLMADTTRSNLEYLEIGANKRAGNLTFKNKRFTSPADERRLRHQYQRTYCNKHLEYIRAVRYHQEHYDPTFPVVNRRGVALIPSLASTDEPTCEPRTSSASKPRREQLKVTFHEGPCRYINGDQARVLEALNNEPHPSRETARHQGSSYLRRTRPQHSRGRYGDKLGKYWEQIEYREDKIDGDLGLDNRGNGEEVSGACRSHSGTTEGHHLPQQQEILARFDSVGVGMAGWPLEFEEQDQWSILEIPQESLSSSARSKQSSVQDHDWTMPESER